jgi:hypothetical protein
MENNRTILNEPISAIDSSIAFKAMCEINGFGSLSDMVKIPVHLLEKKPGMTRHLIMEFWEIMKRNGLERMIMEGLEF